MKTLLNALCRPCRFLFALLSLACLCGVALAEPVPFHVGVIVPLTGPVGESGNSIKNGIELAIREHPELFSNIRFIYDDSQYDVNRALSGYRKLKGTDHASVVYVWGYGPNQAVVPIVEKERFPLIAVTGERSIFKGRNYSIRFCYDIDAVASSLLEHLRRGNSKRLGIVKTEVAYINGLLDAMNRNLHAGESIEIVDVYRPGDTNFKSTIAKLRNASFDAVGVFLLPGQISEFYRESQQLKLTAQTFGTVFFDSLKEVQDAQGGMEGTAFPAQNANPQFVQRYAATYGNDAQVAWAANGYEFALLTGQLFGTQHDQLSSEEILQRYRSATNERGDASQFAFDHSVEAPGFNFRVVIRRIESGRIVDLPN